MIKKIRHKIAQEDKARLSFLGQRTRLLRASKGQALAELAIFASIFLLVVSLLVKYGLSMNYSQQDTMLAFRKALSEAANLNRRGQGSQVVMLNDRSFPDASDAVGIAKHYPVYSSASVTWSENLYGDLDYDDVGYPDDLSPDLPRILLEINDEQITAPGSNWLHTAAVDDRDFTYTRIQDAYSTGDFSIISVREMKSTPLNCDSPNLVGECSDAELYVSGDPEYDNQEHPSWYFDNKSVIVNDYWGSFVGCDPEKEYLESTCTTRDWTETRFCSSGCSAQDEADGNCLRFETAHTRAIDNAQNFFAGGSFDVDWDGRNDTVMEINCSDVSRTSVSGGRTVYYVNNLKFFNYQEGPIDLTFDSRNANAGETRQGIQSDYARDIYYQASIQRDENTQDIPDGIRTVTDIDARETITRTVLLNDDWTSERALEPEIEVQSALDTRRVEEWVTIND